MFRINSYNKARRTMELAVVVVALAFVGLATGCAREDESPRIASGSAVDEAQLRVTEELVALDEQPAEPAPHHKEGAAQETASEPSTIDPLQQQLDDYISQAGMQVGVSVIDLTNGSVASCHDEDAFPSASMIKLLIAYTFLEQVQEGKQSLDAYYTLTSDDLVGGTGNLTYLGTGAQVSYRDALMRMIDVSDNVGANILIDAVGMDAINDCATRLGLSQTQLNRKMMDPSMYEGVENYTSADDLAHLLCLVYEEQFVSPEYGQLVLTALEQQEDWGGIRSGLPEGTIFAHKTGTLATVYHDGGIVEGEHPYVLVVLCGGDGFYPGGALQIMADVARMTSEALA